MVGLFYCDDELCTCYLTTKQAHHELHPYCFFSVSFYYTIIDSRPFEWLISNTTMKSALEVIGKVITMNKIGMTTQVPKSLFN